MICMHGGNVNLLSKGGTTNWLESLKLEKSKYPISLVDQSFASIKVLAEWKSEQDSLLAPAVTPFIEAIDRKLSLMVVITSIKEGDKKSMLKMNDAKKEWLVERRNAERAGKDSIFSTGTVYSNGVRACNFHIELLKDFDKQIKRVDQSGSALKKWAVETRRNQITSEKAKTWGIGGYDATNWNRIFEFMETHWNHIIHTHHFNKTPEAKKTKAKKK